MTDLLLIRRTPGSFLSRAEHYHRDVLFGRLSALAPQDGAHPVSGWAGLTVHRLSGPGWLYATGPLPVAIIVRTLDPPAVALFQPDGRMDIAAPALVCVLPVDPRQLRTVAVEMRLAGTRPESALTANSQLAQSLSRFLDAVSISGDREVLAPLRMQEVVYRLLHDRQCGDELRRAADRVLDHPVAAALEYIADHLAEPLTVSSLAAHVNLSPSAFTRAFRATTGRSPYRYVKEARLDRARQLLGGRRAAVSTVAWSVGYVSVSHFIKEFRSHVGLTPGEYAAAARAARVDGRE
jgi:AraC-like DNA-binding protein